MCELAVCKAIAFLQMRYDIIWSSLTDTQEADFRFNSCETNMSTVSAHTLFCSSTEAVQGGQQRTVRSEMAAGIVGCWIQYPPPDVTLPRFVKPCTF